MPAALHIRRLTLTQFRNYGELRMAPQAGLIVLTGANGAGKTNLLEAVSLLSPGRGLRRAAFSDLAAEGGDGSWAVASEIGGPAGEVALGTGWSPANGNEERGSARQVRIDGVTQRGSGTLGSWFRVLWLTPAMDRLFTGPASDRRRFLDRLVMAFDPDHGGRVTRYERLMRERNKLLDRGELDDGWLSGIELQMAEAAVAISAARCDAVRALADVLRPDGAAPRGPFPWPALEIDGQLERDLDAFSAVDVEDGYRTILADSRRIDMAAGRTTSGPHRSDLDVKHGPKDVAARLCSTGEQKALLIATVLGHARLVSNAGGEGPPVLLLDEIAAHLDPERRGGLFEALGELGAQVWMTGTDPELFDPISSNADCYHVDAGTVSAR